MQSWHILLLYATHFHHHCFSCLDYVDLAVEMTAYWNLVPGTGEKKITLIQQRHPLPGKRQDYQFIKSHGGQWHVHHEMLSHHLEVISMCYTMPFHMGTICPDLTSLIFV